MSFVRSGFSLVPSLPSVSASNPDTFKISTIAPAPVLVF
jgi:hypothetical protein